MAAGWRNTVDQVGMGIRELFSSLHSELGAGLALDPSGLLLLISAGLGLLITAVLWVSVRRGSAKANPENIAPEAGRPPKPRAEEPKKRSRKRAGDKKLQRNGLLSPEEELKPVEPQDQNQDANESPDPAGGKSDKGKKNKKKVKAPAKETKSPTTSERKEPEEVGSWETKVSNREKRQQRRKDKGPADESPGGLEPNPEPTPAPEELQVTITPTASAAKPNKTPKSNKNPSVPAPAAPKREEPPPAEATPAPEVKALVSQIWEDELNVSRSGWRDLGVSVPGVHTWNSVSLPRERQEPEPSLWSQDMEGSWTIVNRSQIPVSFHGLSAGVETQVVPDLSWPCHTPVDDEWSGINSASADPGSDWRAPPEEWGNYEDPAGGAVLAEEPQESDPEKDKDEAAAAAPGSGKAKKKKKRKKKVEESGAARQVEAEVCVSKDRSASASNPTPPTNKESVPLSAPPRVMAKPPEPEAPPNSTAPPTQKKLEESWESPKQVKKKKARRET